MMDTYAEPVTTKRQYRSLEEKQRIVEEALAKRASVAGVARAHGVNANLVFDWCRLYRAGRLRRRSEAKLAGSILAAGGSSNTGTKTNHTATHLPLRFSQVSTPRKLSVAVKFPKCDVGPAARENR
jgi:transposase-like protein